MAVDINNQQRYVDRCSSFHIPNLNPFIEKKKYQNYVLTLIHRSVLSLSYKVYPTEWESWDTLDLQSELDIRGDFQIT